MSVSDAVSHEKYIGKSYWYITERLYWGYNLKKYHFPIFT